LRNSIVLFLYQERFVMAIQTVQQSQQAAVAAIEAELPA